MIVKGIKTESRNVEVDVQPLEALYAIDDFIRRRMGIHHSCWVRLEDGKKVLVVEEDYRHGTPGDEIINFDPSEEVVAYLETYNKMYEFTRNAQYA